MYSGEQKNILFRLSLRKMEKKMIRHNLLKVNLEYYDILSGKTEILQSELAVERGDGNYPNIISSRLDENLNRFYGAKTIIEAIELSNRLQFSDAQKKLKDKIAEIGCSPSGRSSFCQSLIGDLEDCVNGMNDLMTFQTGIHSAHAFVSMYLLERSSGVMNTLRQNILDNNFYNMEELKQNRYITLEQIDGKRNAESLCSQYQEKYRMRV